MKNAQPVILVVEDERLLLEAITTKLKLSGMEPIECVSGKEAIERLKLMVEMPDLIWLDYYLRDMNGLEFMQVLKQSPLWAKIPVVVVSNSASSDKVHQMMMLGASDYLLKADYKLEEIIQIIRNFIDKDRVNKEN